MPKLNPTRAAEVRKAGEQSNLGALPIGKYRVKLKEVESTTAKPKDGKREGNPMWVWKFTVIEFLDGTDEIGSDRVLFYRTVIQDNTLWDLDRVFAAFEAEPDMDTDELIGNEIIVFVDQEVITGGKRKGEIGNNVKDFFTLSDGLASDKPMAMAGGSTDDPAF